MTDQQPVPAVSVPLLPACLAGKVSEKKETNKQYAAFRKLMNEALALVDKVPLQLPNSQNERTLDDESELGIILASAGCFDESEFRLVWPLPDTHKRMRDHIGARLPGCKTNKFLEDPWDVGARPQQGLLKPVVKDAYKLLD